MTKAWEELQSLQPLVLQIISNSIMRDRVAHAYLFEGQRGTGKLKASILFAKSLFCKVSTNGVPCDHCVNCKRIENKNHPDVHIIEPEGLSIKKDQIRALQEEFSKTGVESTKKFYIIVDADKMTVNAANSLLKFLEEPQSDTTAVLITEQIHRILPTIISRCQTLSFKPLPNFVIKKRLIAEGISDEVAALVANLTNNLDEALQIAQDEWFAQARKIVLKLYDVLRKKSLQGMVQLQENFFLHFKEKPHIDRALDLLLLIYKDLLYIGINHDELAFPDYKSEWEAQALHLSTNRLSEQMTLVLDAKRKLNANMNTQLLMEELVLKLQGGYTFV
ncbi:DNA polymerase III subunit delta' [Bacillus spongiae]|uniref:DNA polymerase III subunit delta n=1 Tax=Bacillus spongiae TaxID=2683610 RepID=A0ABU8HJM5_9BACI